MTIMPHRTWIIHPRLPPVTLTVYVILFAALTVPMWSGDTTRHQMNFQDVFKHMPPRPAYAQGMEGEVLIDVKIDTNGHVAEVRCVNTAGDIIDTMFTKALRKLKGKPLRIDGKAEEIWIPQLFRMRTEYGGKGLDPYENAFFNYTRSLENDTTNAADRFYGRGRAHYLFGDIEAARTDFETAQSLGCTKVWFEDFQLGLAERWLPTDTTDFDALLYRAELYGRYGLYERARVLYIRLCRMKPNAIAPLRGLMQLYGNRRDYQGASGIAAVVMQRADHPTADDLRLCCWWLYSVGRYGRAVAAGEAGMGMAADLPTRSYGSVNYAIALLAHGQLAAARAEYKKIISSHIEEAVGDLKRHIRLGRPNTAFAREILADVFHLGKDEIP